MESSETHKFHQEIENTESKPKLPEVEDVLVKEVNLTNKSDGQRQETTQILDVANEHLLEDVNILVVPAEVNQNKSQLLLDDEQPKNSFELGGSGEKESLSKILEAPLLCSQLVEVKGDVLLPSLTEKSLAKLEQKESQLKVLDVPLPGLESPATKNPELFLNCAHSGNPDKKESPFLNSQLAEVDANIIPASSDSKFCKTELEQKESQLEVLKQPLVGSQQEDPNLLLDIASSENSVQFTQLVKGKGLTMNSEYMEKSINKESKSTEEDSQPMQLPNAKPLLKATKPKTQTESLLNDRNKQDVKKSSEINRQDLVPPPINTQKDVLQVTSLSHYKNTKTSKSCSKIEDQSLLVSTDHKKVETSTTKHKFDKTFDDLFLQDLEKVKRRKNADEEVQDYLNKQTESPSFYEVSIISEVKNNSSDINESIQDINFLISGVPKNSQKSSTSKRRAGKERSTTVPPKEKTGEQRIKEAFEMYLNSGKKSNSETPASSLEAVVEETKKPLTSPNSFTISNILTDKTDVHKAAAEPAKSSNNSSNTNPDPLSILLKEKASGCQLASSPYYYRNPSPPSTTESTQIQPTCTTTTSIQIKNDDMDLFNDSVPQGPQILPDFVESKDSLRNLYADPSSALAFSTLPSYQNNYQSNVLVSTVPTTFSAQEPILHTTSADFFQNFSQSTVVTQVTASVAGDSLIPTPVAEICGNKTGHDINILQGNFSSIPVEPKVSPDVISAVSSTSTYDSSVLNFLEDYTDYTPPAPLNNSQEGDHSYSMNPLIRGPAPAPNQEQEDCPSDEYKKTFTEYPMDPMDLDFQFDLIEEASASSSGIIDHSSPDAWFPMNPPNPDDSPFEESSKVIVEAQPSFPEFSCLNKDSSGISEFSQDSENNESILSKNSLNISDLSNLFDSIEQHQSGIIEESKGAADKAKSVEGKRVPPKKHNNRKRKIHQVHEQIPIPSRTHSRTKVVASRKDASPPTNEPTKTKKEDNEAQLENATDEKTTNETSTLSNEGEGSKNVITIDSVNALPQLVPINSRITRSKGGSRENYVTPESQSEYLHAIETSSKNDENGTSFIDSCSSSTSQNGIENSPSRSSKSAIPGNHVDQNASLPADVFSAATAKSVSQQRKIPKESSASKEPKESPATVQTKVKNNAPVSSSLEPPPLYFESRSKTRELQRLEKMQRDFDLLKSGPTTLKGRVNSYKDSYPSTNQSKAVSERYPNVAESRDILKQSWGESPHRNKQEPTKKERYKPYNSERAPSTNSSRSHEQYKREARSSRKATSSHSEQRRSLQTSSSRTKSGGARISSSELERRDLFFSDQDGGGAMKSAPLFPELRKSESSPKNKSGRASDIWEEFEMKVSPEWLHPSAAGSGNSK